MQGKNHVALAIAAPLALSLWAGPEFLPGSAGAWAGLVAGSLAPDLDGGGAICRPSAWLPRIIPRWITIVLDQIGLTISRLVQNALGHRGPLHWGAWGAAMAGAGLYLGQGWLLWLGVGWLLHLAGDVITVSGVPLLGPVFRENLSLSPMRTGGKLETLLGVGLWGFVAWQSGLAGLGELRDLTGAIQSLSVLSR